MIRLKSKEITKRQLLQRQPPRSNERPRIHPPPAQQTESTKKFTASNAVVQTSQPLHNFLAACPQTNIRDSVAVPAHSTITGSASTEGTGTVSSDVQYKCKWWPVCKLEATVCGGKRKNKCIVYGDEGTKRQKRPSDEELARATRFETWSETAKSRDCAYFPICSMKAVDCGGSNKQSCCIYGIRGSKHPPSDSLLTEAKNSSKLKKNRERKRAKRAAAKGQPSKNN